MTRNTFQGLPTRTEKTGDPCWNFGEAVHKLVVLELMICPMRARQRRPNSRSISLNFNSMYVGRP